MSAERLSRLQKWILEEVYIYGNKAALLRGGRTDVWRREIYIRACNDGLFKGHKDNPNRPTLAPMYSSKVIFSRSVWGLIEKKYLESVGPTRLNLMAVAYGMSGGTEAEFKEEFADVLKEPKGKQAVPGPAVRGIVQAKILTLTLKGRAKAKQLLALKEGLKVNKDKLAIRLGPGAATVEPERGEIDTKGGDHG